MAQGKILAAAHEGVNLVKLVGDVRLTFSVSMDSYIESLMADEHFCAIVFDLTDAELLDSTTLGLMAKIAIQSNESKHHQPLLVCSDPNLNRLLDSMGITELCDLLHQLPDNYCQIVGDHSQPLPSAADEEVVRAKVLEAHCTLMSLNESNKETFKDLVQSLGRA